MLPRRSSVIFFAGAKTNTGNYAALNSLTSSCSVFFASPKIMVVLTPEGLSASARPGRDRCSRQNLIRGDGGQTVQMNRSKPAPTPDPHIIAREIVEDLQAALSQFAAIAADLNARAYAN